jgi:hypothetical protein
MAAKVGRFDRSLEALHIDGKGHVSDQTTSIKELLLNTEMHVRACLCVDLWWKRSGLTVCVCRGRSGGLIMTTPRFPADTTHNHAHQVRDLMALSPDSLHKKGGRLTPCILPRGN